MDIRKFVYMEKGRRHNGTGKLNSEEGAGQRRAQRPLAWMPITPHMTLSKTWDQKQSKRESIHISSFLY